MEVVRPQAEGVLADEGPLDQAAGGGLVGEAGGLGGQLEVEGVQQRDRAQQVALVAGEVGQRAGDQGTEVVLEIGRGRGVAGAVQFDDGEVEVERQPVGAGGDHVPDGGGDERGTVGFEAAGEVVVAVLGGEVADQDLPAADGRGVGKETAGVGDVAGPGGDGKAGPGGGAGVVELALEGGLGPLQAGAAGDDEERVRHQPHDPLDEALQVAVGAVADVLEGVQQDHRRHLLVGREPGELPDEQVRVEGERLQVGIGLQQVGEPETGGERAYGLAPLAQRPRQGTGQRAGCRSDGAGQEQRQGDVGERGLHLLRHRLTEPGGQPAALEVEAPESQASARGTTQGVSTTH
ncbi:hypothetical protein [Streptomyces sp. NPDC058855]|uniref:hypothetical protein n=1 Tax=Streptomyces sp. NPDC058855 TaxID=3346651 RepID=UPI0036A23F9C